MTVGAAKQRAPTSSKRSREVLPYVQTFFADGHPECDAIADALTKRAAAGKKKYGTALLTFNGRSALEDALQEQLDTMMYLGQANMEDPLDRDIFKAFINAQDETIRLVGLILTKGKDSGGGSEA